jgi:hypothetical protein
MSWWQTAKVGDKVVCVIETSWWKTPDDEILPQENVEYTIRTIEVSGADVFLRLVEIVNAPQMYMQGFSECRFIADAFRPITPRQTDISMFTAMLNPQRVPEGVG